MAFFTAVGVISNDIVRRETKSGVVATFRLETGAPRGRKLWIDIECWGHLAGTIAHRGSTGRAAAVTGRLVQWSWRSHDEGQNRRRIAIRALDIDLLGQPTQPSHHVPNKAIAVGRLESPAPIGHSTRRDETRLLLRSGRAGSKTGALSLDVRLWRTPDDDPPPDLVGRHVVVDGSMEWDQALGTPIIAAATRQLRLCQGS